MSEGSQISDLVILVPDKNIEFAVRGLLSRPESMGIRRPSYAIYAHPERDPGCRLRADDFLSVFAKQFSHALVIFDLEGSGGQDQGRKALEEDMEGRLARKGWTDCAAIVIDPELEIWVWSDSPEVDSVLGWTGRNPSLREWLRDRNLLADDAVKPLRPKEAMEACLRESGRKRSSSIYEELASRVSFNRCTDPAFEKLKSILQTWFGASIDKEIA